MKHLKFFAMLVLGTSLLVACKKDDADTTKPEIVLNEPADGDTLFIGYDTHLEMDLSDNVKLKSYKVDIHNNFDNHSHTKSDVAGAWTFTKSWDVSGLKNTHIHHHEIEVPDSVGGVPIAAGNYHFMLYCTDEAGNESYVVRNVVVGKGIPHEED